MANGESGGGRRARHRRQRNRHRMKTSVASAARNQPISAASGASGKMTVILASDIICGNEETTEAFCGVLAVSNASLSIRGYYV